MSEPTPSREAPRANRMAVPPGARPDAHREVPDLRTHRPAGPEVARKGHHPRARVVQRRPSRRQPGPRQPDGPRAQAAHVRDARQDGLQGDRGRVPGGLGNRLRFLSLPHRERRDPGRRHRPGPHPVAARAHHPYLRERRGREAGDRPSLQLDLDPAAPGGVRAGPGGNLRDRRRAARSWYASSPRPAPRRTGSTNTRRRASRGPSSSTRSRSARR